MRILLILFAILAALFQNTVSSFAQDTAEKSSLIKYVEQQLSTPNRKISLNGLEGSLSSSVSLASITIADNKGVWLKIVKPSLVWTRSALLSGTLDIDSLVAERIDYLRNEEPDEALPTPEAAGFSFPELPVSVILRKLSVPIINFGQPVFGLAAKTSIDGNIALAEGGLNLDLAIKRLDGPGGDFKVKGIYTPASRMLDLDAKLTEPENGIMANLLGLKNRPPVAILIKGKAPVDDLRIGLAFDVANRRILGGDLRLDGVSEGTRIQFDLGGPLASILPERTREFFGHESKVSADVMLAKSGEIDVRTVNLKSGVVNLSATAKRLADGFISALKLDVSLDNDGASPIDLPVADTPIKLSSARFALDFDAANSAIWAGRLNLSDFSHDGIKFDNILLNIDGTVTEFDDPSNRAIGFTLNGLLDGFRSANPALNEAVGGRVKLIGGGSRKTGAPLLLQQFSIIGETIRANVSGEFAENNFNGVIKIDASRLSAFAALAERPLTGRASLRADGNVALVGGRFDLRINGITNDLGIGDEQVDPLLVGKTTLAGGIARGEHGLAFRGLRLANKSFETLIDGVLSSSDTNLVLDAVLRNVATLTPRASGEMRLQARLAGSQKPYDLNADLGMNSGSISNRTVKGLAINFSGLTDGAFIRGTMNSQGFLDRKPVKLSGYINADALILSLQKLLVEVGDAKLSGNMERSDNGLIDASLDVDAADISDLAALALVRAEGAVNGTVKLSSNGGKQNARVNITTRNLRYEAHRIQSGTINANGEDLYGRPSVDALLDVSGIRVAGIDVRTLDGRVKTSGNETKFDIRAALDRNSARVQTAGRLIRQNGDLLLRLDDLSLKTDIANARLREPAILLITDGIAHFSDAALHVDDGVIRLSGSAGKKLDLDIGIESLPLSIIDALRPQTGATGVVSGTAKVTGVISDPAVVFNLSGSGVSLQQLTDAGLSPLSGSAKWSVCERSFDTELCIGPQ